MHQVVYIQEPRIDNAEFLEKLQTEGFACEILPPAVDLRERIGKRRPILILFSLGLGANALAKLTLQSREWFPEIPVVFVGRCSALAHSETGTLLPEADGICYMEMPALHLAFALRSVIRSSFQIQNLQDSNRKLNEISITDALTGLYNRGFMIDRLGIEFKRAGRNRKTLSCLMIDLDHFKTINDTYGHKLGDIVLQAVASRLSELIRDTDIFGRYGGEELLIILPDTNLEGAALLAEKLRDGLASRHIVHEYFSLHVTASFGVASTECPEVITADHLLQLSDRALYQAKEAGRNCVRIVGLGERLTVAQAIPESDRRRAPRGDAPIDILTPDASDANPYMAWLRASQEFEPIAHCSAEDFYQAFRQREPTLILVDLSNGFEAGLDICRRIKDQVRELFIPILILLRECSASVREAALALGVDEVMEGEIAQEQLLARLRAMKRLKSLHDRWRSTHQDLNMARTRLVKVERLTALGEMATGVAHDFNNILSTILGRARLLRQRIDDPETIRNLDIIEKAASEGAATIRRIQDFSRATTDRAYEGVDMVQVVHDCIQMTHTRWKDEAELKGVAYRFRTDFPVPLPVLGSPAELREVITNLILNALDAMPLGGEMVFDGSVVNDEVTLTIHDTGKGMDEDVLKRVFDPFFSTKEGGGAGLGLSVAYGIVARHNGRIDCSSAVGQGATFRICLPHHPDALRGAQSDMADRSAPAAPLLGDEARKERSLRILVVDDEAPIREIFRDVLSEDGHRVYVAESGEEALALAEEKEIDLVFTDLSMPGMNGWEVARRLRKLNADLPIVLTSGWGSDFSRELLEKHGIDYVLPKPVPFESLAALTRQVLDGKTIQLADQY